MKITIRNETEEPTMELWLQRSGDEVILRGKDEKGDRWNMIIISADGIILCTNLAGVGWPVDADGRLKLVNR